ncbi:MAG: pyridoxamine 5'-phosphate oxidase family protein [Candidatus Aceula meridiana]|nr:pyridoxamine 5'-phosphate oxidase family protein [Candidatus Aceula meridiana]
MKLSKDIINFFEKQGGVVVATLDSKGRIHSSVKGVVSVKGTGKIFLIDLYLYRTFCNLKKNPTISLTAVDEHLFKGYSLQGKAKIIPLVKIKEAILEEWEKKVASRITTRVAKSVRMGKKSHKHHEAHLPVAPKYLIEVSVSNIINLSPPATWKQKCHERD